MPRDGNARRIARVINQLDEMIHSEPTQSYPRIVEFLESAHQEFTVELGDLLAGDLIEEVGDDR